MDNLQPGQTLGPYRIINQIGQGGMATVYKAYHAAMDRYVAIKVLPRQLAESPEFIGRFQQEARTIANLEHPHILPVHDYGESDGITYLVMRYFDAGTLKNRLRSGPLSLAEVDRLFAQLAEALAYAHAHGVVHRDLKPANVLVDAQDNVFLTDFGIAKLLEGSSHFTATGAMVGTPAYMSPEQVLGQKVDQRSDIYSLGIVLYEMVTGREPFEADTPLAVALKHVNEPLPLPSAVKPGLAPDMERVVLKALAKNPDDRFATAADFLAAWKQALREAEGVTEQAPAQAIAMASAATTAHPTAPVPASSAASPAAQAVRPAARPALSLGLIGLLMVGLVGICVLVAVGGFFATRGLTPLTSQGTPSPSVMATPDEIGSILATVTQFAREGPATVEAIIATVTAAGGNVTALPLASPTLIPPPAIPLSRGLRVTQRALLEVDLAKQVIWSPDGKLLAVGTYHIYFYDAQTLKQVRVIEAIQWVDSMAFSPDGALLASASYEGVKLWDVASGGELRTLAGSKGSKSVAFSPDGALLVTATGDALKLWDAASGAELRTIPGGGLVTVVAFSPDGRTLASGGQGDVKLWDPATGKELRTLKGNNNLVSAVAFSPDGKLLASGASDNTVRVWEVASGRALLTLTGHTGTVNAVAFSPDGQTLASASGDLTVKLWDVVSGTELIALTGHTRAVNTVAFSPDGATLASGAEDGAIRLWGVAP